jgi:hypothetical protein
LQRIWGLGCNFYLFWVLCVVWLLQLHLYPSNTSLYLYTYLYTFLI